MNACGGHLEVMVVPTYCHGLNSGLQDAKYVLLFREPPDLEALLVTSSQWGWQFSAQDLERRTRSY